MPNISEVEAMYQDQFDDDLSHVPTLNIPTNDAPPFDFAVTSNAPRRFNTMMAPMPRRPVFAIGRIDDFDHDARDPDAAHVKIFQGDGSKHVFYRPRLRDLLFASAVGKGTGRREMMQEAVLTNSADRTDLELDIQRLHDHAHEVDKAEQRLKQELKTMEQKTAPQATMTANDTFETIRGALHAVMEQDGEIDELTFEHLKPAKQRSEVPVPDNVFAGVVKSKAPQTIENDEGAQHVADILAQRNYAASGQSEPRPSRFSGALSMSTARGARNWAIFFFATTVLLVALIVFAAL